MSNKYAEMRYVQNNLLTDEKIIYAVRPHWIIYSNGVGFLLFALLIYLYAPVWFYRPVYETWTISEILVGGCIILGIYGIIKSIIFYLTSEYAITNRRVVIKIGWIQRRSLEIFLEKAEGVLVDQSIPGRILNYGSVNIIGTGGTDNRFPFIPSPLKFRKIVQEEIEKIEASARTSY